MISKISLSISFLLVFCLWDHSLSAQSKKKTVAVLEFNSSSREIGKDELTTLSNRFRSILVKTDAFDVLERQKMSDILKEQNFAMSDNCNSAECAVQVGQLLGVEVMIAGDIGKLGSTYSIDLRIINVSTGKIIRTETQDHKGEIDGLFKAMADIANSFAGIKSNASSNDVINRSSGTIDVVSDGTLIDSRDGRKYKTVKIGNQVWMAENLNYITSSGSWYYDKNPANGTTYGLLYDWATAMTVAPPGWHLPTDNEWTTLINYLGGESVAGGKLREVGTVYWKSPNVGATNESGFTALPGGCRFDFGTFLNIGSDGGWWSATEGNATNAWGRTMSNREAWIYRHNYGKAYVISVRCVKD